MIVRNDVLCYARVGDGWRKTDLLDPFGCSLPASVVTDVLDVKVVNVGRDVCLKDYDGQALAM